MSSDSLVKRAAEFHSWDAMAPAALEALVRRGPFESTCETGCGGSTIVLSNSSKRHVAFAIEGENRTITALRRHPELRGEAVTFVEGESIVTIPAHSFAGPLDLVLLDGPHAYPLPQVEFAYLFPGLRVGGWLVLDDIQIPSVYELFRFLRQEKGVELEEVAVRTAFFRNTEEGASGPDGWERQGMNRRPVLRYSWRDQLRKLMAR
ncbi:MAG TPA: class I SAM-dependent methyltransferase [Bryobacteraceae bacterium]|nr:class I SAM-dependent methyltransferase [Bryobacteraceae bacterium]